MSRAARPHLPPASAAVPAGRDLGLGLLLLASVVVTYLPALGGGFIWNDLDYVTAPELRDGMGLARIWFELGATEQYYPLLHSAFWVQHRLWGDAPSGYHLATVLQHAASAWLLTGLLRRLAIPGAWLAAFLFALHPVMVESVAWISEQKNTLSLLFYLAAARQYLRFDSARGGRVYLAATLLFVAALLTKSVTATLPPALLVIFWWRRGRLEWRRDVQPLLPWFALGAAMGLLSAYVERVYIGAHGEEFGLDAVQRVLLAGRVAWFYAAKLVWPAGLVFIYPRWQVDAGELAQWLYPLGVVLLLAALWAWRRRTRAPLAAALFFGGSLFPTLGFFNVYAFLYSYVADHWQYLPALGLIVLAAAGLARALAAPGVPPFARRALPVLGLAALAGVSFHQSRTFTDLRTFYRVTIERNPAAWMAHNNLGNLLREAGELAAARGHFEAALQVRPDLFRVHYNLALVLRQQRETGAAETHLRRAVALRPQYAEAHNQLGSLLRETGRPAEALRHLFAALQADPLLADVRNNLGMTLRDLGRNTDAIRQFHGALRLQPGMAAAHLNLALSYAQAGRGGEAATHLREARRLNPRIPDVRLD